MGFRILAIFEFGMVTHEASENVTCSESHNECSMKEVTREVDSIENVVTEYPDGSPVISHDIIPLQAQSIPSRIARNHLLLSFFLQTGGREI